MYAYNPAMHLAAGRDLFRRLWREVRDVQSARSLLEWDQETYMPAAGALRRGQVLATSDAYELVYNGLMKAR